MFFLAFLLLITNANSFRYRLRVRIASKYVIKHQFSKTDFADSIINTKFPEPLWFHIEEVIPENTAIVSPNVITLLSISVRSNSDINDAGIQNWSKLESRMNEAEQAI
jgi:hypothetical protein